MNNNNYIIFSSIDWSTHWQLHHQLVTSLVSAGNKVFFVENTGIRSINIEDIGRLRERISSWKKGIHGFSSIDGEKLTVYSPIILPIPYSKKSLEKVIEIRKNLELFMVSSNIQNKGNPRFI